MGLVYRIPSKPWYREHRADPDLTWQKVYGDKKCAVCGQNYRELEGYMMCPDGKQTRHVECPPCEYLNDAGGCTINCDCNQRSHEDRLKRQCKVPVERRRRSNQQCHVGERGEPIHFEQGVAVRDKEDVGPDDFRF